MASKFDLLDYFLSQDKSLPYQSNLSTPEAFQFAKWASQNQVPVDLSQNSDYDMAGFFKAQQLGKASSGVSPIDNRVHYTDTFKTPVHETFSNESKYAGGINAPHWEGNSQRDDEGNLVSIELPGGEIVKLRRGIR